MSTICCRSVCGVCVWGASTYKNSTREAPTPSLIVAQVMWRSAFLQQTYWTIRTSGEQWRGQGSWDSQAGSEPPRLGRTGGQACSPPSVVLYEPELLQIFFLPSPLSCRGHEWMRFGELWEMDAVCAFPRRCDSEKEVRKTGAGARRYRAVTQSSYRHLPLEFCTNSYFSDSN